jgi:hypothetical protein
MYGSKWTASFGLNIFNLSMGCCFIATELPNKVNAIMDEMLIFYDMHMLVPLHLVLSFFPQMQMRQNIDTIQSLMCRCGTYVTKIVLA